MTGRVGDTVVVAPAEGCVADVRVPTTFRVGTMADLQRWEGDRGARSSHVLIGSVVGLAAGAVIGRVAAGDGCRVSPCDGGLATLGKTIIGAGAGLLAGGLVGALLPAGTRWVRAGASQPIRLVGLMIRPGIHVAVGRGRH